MVIQVSVANIHSQAIKGCLILTLFFSLQVVHGQDLEWVFSAGDFGTVQTSSVVCDDMGNSYWYGYFTDSVDFDPGPQTFMLYANMSSAGLFICKYNTNGQLLWAKSLNGNGFVEPRSMVVDDLGNIYLTGSFLGSLTIDTAAVPMLSYGGEDLFYCALKSNGSVKWAFSLGGQNGGGGGWSIATDNIGNVYSTGRIVHIYDFDPDTANTYAITPMNGRNLYLSRFDTNGSLNWAFAYPGNATDKAGPSVAVDPSGNVVLVGKYSGIHDFDPGSDSLMLSANYEDIFISKFTATGKLLWAKSIGGVGEDYANSITIDKIGNIYLTGMFNGNVDFDPGSSVFTLNTNEENKYILKLTSDGDFAWVQNLGKVFCHQDRYLAVDNDQNVYTTGYFSGTVDFDPGQGTQYLTATFQDIYINKLNTLGGLIWAHKVSDLGLARGHSIDVDNNGNIYSTGFFTKTAMFDFGGNQVQLATKYDGKYDGYLLKLSQPDFSTNEPVEASDFSLYPNPSTSNVTLTSREGTEITDLNVYNLIGQKQQTSFDRLDNNSVNLKVGNLHSGLYSVIVLFKGGTSSLTKISVSR